MMKQLFGLIGHPVGHSLSPLMHNNAFAAQGLRHYYHSFDVDPDNLKTAVDGMRVLGVSGFNVTVPHKVAVMAHLDDIDEEARHIGAVNTVLNQEGRLIGTNTDGRGYVLALKETAGEALADKQILLIGAGGASRGVVSALDREGVGRLDVANRTFSKAQTLIEQNMTHAESRALTLEEAAGQTGVYDIIINTTTVGMSPDIEQTPLDLTHIRKGTIVSDLIYNPLETTWLKEAEAEGAVILNGVDMFVNQGALAFEYWTGQSPDRRQMRHHVVKQLSTWTNPT